MSQNESLNTPPGDEPEVPNTPWISRRALLKAAGVLAGAGALGIAAFTLTKRHVLESARSLLSIPAPTDGALRSSPSRSASRSTPSPSSIRWALGLSSRASSKCSTVMNSCRACLASTKAM